MRRKLIMLATAISLLLSVSAPAMAHVHGITPLLACSVDNPNSGGNGTNGTPADAANGGPIAGLIPRDTGNAPLAIGDGGFGATGDNCP
jgi:hypothetical protein